MITLAEQVASLQLDCEIAENLAEQLRKELNSTFRDENNELDELREANDQLLLERGELINENYELRYRLRKVMNYANDANEMEDL